MSDENKPVKPIDLLRAIFGEDCVGGDVIHLDGDEEPSGRIPFTLEDADGEIKRCGVTPGYVTVRVSEEDDARATLARVRAKCIGIIAHERAKIGTLSSDALPDARIHTAKRILKVLDEDEG